MSQANKPLAKRKLWGRAVRNRFRRGGLGSYAEAVRSRYPFLHRDTRRPEPIPRPLRTALFNTLVWLWPLSVPLLIYSAAIRERGFSVWLLPFGLALALAVLLIFGQAYLGARIGGRRAYNWATGVAGVVLSGLAIAWVVWFVRELLRAG